jgi:hypothetical protein
MPTFIRRRGTFFVFAAVIVASVAAVAVANLQDRAGFLWIAESGGVLNIATDSGAVRFELQTTLGTSALGVNDYNGDIWAYGHRRLLGFDRAGALRFDVETPVPMHGGDPADLVVDGGAGTLWLAIKRDLYRYDLQGNLRQALVLPRNIVAATLDRDRSILWVAQEQQLRLYDADGALTKTVDLAPTEKVLDIAYDRRNALVWVAMPDRLLRYGADGSRAWEILGSYAGAIAPDGAGGLWQARGSVLLNYDAAGAQQWSVEPFAGQPDKAIIDVVADPHDGSVWVASRRSVAHYGADGERIALLQDLGDGVIKRLSRSALYADLDPPEMAITAPGQGALLRNNQPAIELSYFDLGVGVDPDSIRISAASTTIPVSCSASATTARCVPVAPLPEGPVTIRATIADRMLNASEPAELALVIDTQPPVIRIDYPAADTMTREPTLIITGALSEAGTLAVDGTSVPVDDAGRFSVGRTLREGPNTFSLLATDRAGNTSARSVHVVLDTVVPPVPSADLIEIGEPEGDQVAVTGAPGAVEAGATVRIVNLRTGQTVSVTAAADGSFEASIAAGAGDQLSVTVVDGAGNTSESLAAKVPAALGVVITEPIDGAEFKHDFALVSGTLKGPLNAAIVVNGLAATMISEGDQARFYATVPLKAGWNDLNVVATLQSGATLTGKVRVNRVETPLSLKVTPAQGTASLGVRFDVLGGFDFYDTIRYDFNGDGKFDFVTGARLSGSNFASYIYSMPGIYRPVVQVTRYNYIRGVFEVIYQPTVSVVALSAAQLQQHRDRVLRSVWTGLQDALRAGDVPRALTAVTFDSRTTYGEVFESLLPQMSNILGDITNIEPLALSNEYAEYAVMNMRGEPRVHIIGFLRGADGIWRIDQM